MSLAEQIAALPAWPDDLSGYPPPDDAEWNDYLHDKIGCVFARLALAREWVADAKHRESCVFWNAWKADGCDCGRDALLAALEPPK